MSPDRASAIGLRSWTGATLAKKSALVATMLFGATTLDAGPLAVISGKYSTFSFRSVAEQDTPNYYGYGAGVSAGVSVEQVVDVAMNASYFPGTRGATNITKADAFLFQWGPELAVRIVGTVYLGVRGGLVQYAMREPRPEETDLIGRHRGQYFGASFGGLRPFSKESALQVSLDMHHSVINHDDGRRFIDGIALSLGWAYNSRKGLISGSLLDFFNTF